MKTGKLATLSAVSALSLLACDARTLIGMVPDASPPDSGSAPDSWPTDSNDGAVTGNSPDATDGFVGGFTVDAGKGTCTPVTWPGDTPAALPAGAAGNWTGYFQGSSPLGTSDAVKFSIRQRSDGSGEILVTMGTAVPPPPATSATDYYPPGLMMATPISSPWLIDGFTYLAHEVKWQGSRLQMSIPLAQPWESWCALQPTYAVVDAPGRYNCIPGINSRSSSMFGCFAEDDQGRKETPISCAEMAMCSISYCTCDSCGCAASTASTAGFDVTLDGDTITGVGDGHNVRLTRDPN